jgi:long-chain acyl-CoA synthetase
VQTHANHLAVLESVAGITAVGPGDVHLLFLPLAHSFARLEAFIGVHRGLTTAFAENVRALPDNLREVRPTLLVGVPLVFERAYRKVLGALQASPLRRRVSAWAIGVGRAVSERCRAGRPLPPGLRWQHALARRLVFARIHEGLGGRLRFAVSGGAPLPREIAEFFHAAGILILEGYGLTEACPVLTFNRLDRFKFGSVGLPIPGVEIVIAPDGEILARGPGVARRGYLGRPQETAETFTADGWLRTGDIGSIDAEGFVFITDRKKDLIVTSGGLNIAPQNIENLLRSDPLIAQAMVYGDRRPYLVALLGVGAEDLRRIAHERAIPMADQARLSRQPEILARVDRIVEDVNARLPSHARIRRFALLPTALTEETGELTPTQKVKRRVVAEKYRDLLESLYA